MSTFTLSFCDSRRKKQLYNVPLSRVEVGSPYIDSITGEPAVDSTGVPITRTRLDMRRKVEILKYSSNRMPSQTNSLTKKERWSRLANADGKSARLLDPETVVCPGETSVRVPRPMRSSASGVPGPNVDLYEDPQVPLYNFIITRSYAYNVPNDNQYWKTTINTNVGIGNGLYDSPLFAINIQPSINRTSASFSLDIPVGLLIQGTYTPTSNSAAKTMRVDILSATLTILCNGKSVPDIPPRAFTMPPSSRKYLTIQLAAATSATPIVFTSTRYVGNLSISDIQLATSYIYVYEFIVSLELSMTTNVPLTSFVINKNTKYETNTLQYVAYANMTGRIPQTTTNVSVVATSLGDVSPTTNIPEPILFGI